MIRSRAAIALLIAPVLVLQGCSSSESRPDIVAYFRDVGDLVSRAQVQVNDVEVGQITAIDLVTRDGEMVARVEMELDEDVSIPATDLDAVVRQTSLLGEQFVQLVPGSGGAPFVGDVPVEIPVERTDRRVDIETFLGDLSAFVGSGGLEDLNRFTHAQAVILEDRGRRFGETIEELATLTETLAGRRSDIGIAIEHLGSAATTLAANKQTLDSFLDSLEEANSLLADQGDELGRLFAGLRRFGEVNARFLARHEDAIGRGFRALRPIFRGLASAQNELRRDIAQLAVFIDLFPRSFGGGPGGSRSGDYIQVDAVLCEILENCHTQGEKGDVPGQGS